MIKKALKKLWYFIWEDDSIWSWVVNIVLAFILIKFIIYPGLGFMFQTSYPVVAVVSSSMEHEGSFDDWWESNAICSGQTCTQEQWYLLKEINEETFKTFKFKNGFNKGDIMVLFGTEPKNIKIGDVLVFQSREKPDPIIHRVVEIDNTTFQTKGDHNTHQGSLDQDITEENVIGKAVFRIPLLGWIKIVFIETLKLLHII